MPSPTLHLMCGKIASGKSTLARQLATQHRAIVLSEDYWLSRLYPSEIRTVKDYVRYSKRIRDVVGPLVIDLLDSGLDVVLDFPANTVVDRAWLRSLADSRQLPHCLHYLDVDDDTCRARLHARNERGEHDFAATDAEFDLINSYFCMPGQEEGLAIVWHGR